MNIRSIAAPPPIQPERMRGGMSILEPVAGHDWESRVVLNPAAVLVEDGPELASLARDWKLPDDETLRLREAGGVCVMLYRAQGGVDASTGHAPSSLGLALFTPEMDLVRRWPQPVLRPDADFHNLGVEDARCTRIGDRYYLYYAGYSGRHLGTASEERRIRICLATTSNFLEWQLHGPLTGPLNDVDNKNAALFPQPVGGKFLLLHRPMSGEDAMNIHLAEADAPEGPWRSRGLFMRGFRYAEFERSWIGAGGPPVGLGEDRFLMIYHMGNMTAGGHREYDLAAALLDFSAPDPVRARIEPLMRPEAPGEREGDADLGVDNVLFTCANFRTGDDLVIPYAGADSRIFAARASIRGLLDQLGA